MFAPKLFITRVIFREFDTTLISLMYNIQNIKNPLWWSLMLKPFKWNFDAELLLLVIFMKE